MTAGTDSNGTFNTTSHNLLVWVIIIKFAPCIENWVKWWQTQDDFESSRHGARNSKRIWKKAVKAAVTLPLNPKYRPSTDKWVCTCPQFATSRFLLCKLSSQSRICRLYFFLRSNDIALLHFGDPESGWGHGHWNKCSRRSGDDDDEEDLTDTELISTIRFASLEDDSFRNFPRCYITAGGAGTFLDQMITLKQSLVNDMGGEAVVYEELKDGYIISFCSVTGSRKGQRRCRI